MEHFTTAQLVIMISVTIIGVTVLIFIFRLMFLNEPEAEQPYFDPNDIDSQIDLIRGARHLVAKNKTVLLTNQHHPILTAIEDNLVTKIKKR